MKKIETTKYKTYTPSTISYFRENMKFLLNEQNYPQAIENLGMWRKLISQADLDPDQFKEIILKSKELTQPYSKIGYVINQLAKRKKPKQKVFVETLFGKEELK
jgi:hypothetical protein